MRLIFAYIHKVETQNACLIAMKTKLKCHIMLGYVIVTLHPHSISTRVEGHITITLVM